MSSYESVAEDDLGLEQLPTNNEGFDIYQNHQGCFCTDWYCLIIFILSLIALIVFFGIGFSQGKPKRLISPLTGKGEFCGLDSKKNFPYLYMPNFPFSFSEESLCISRCPTPGKQCIHTDGSVTNTAEDSCTGDSVFAYADFPFNDTISVLYRCIPNVKDTLQNSSVYGGVSDFFSIVVHDISQSWWVFLVVFALTIAISVIFLCLLRCCAGCIIWGSIISCVVFVFALGLIVLISGIISYRKPLKTDKTSSIVFMAFGGILIATSALISVVACCCLRRQISLAAGIVSEASSALGDVWTVYLSPVFYLVLFMLFVVCFIVTLVYYCSAFEIDTTNGEKTLKLKTSQRAIVWISFFIFLWVMAFLIGSNQTTIAGAATAWYFTRRKEQLATFSAGASALNLLLHHIGSVAVGSFLIALVYFIRAIVLYIQSKMKGEIKESRIAQCLCGCLNCCLACLSRVLEFITSNAYIVLSIYGNSFFSSASTAVGLLTRNPARTLVFTGISRFIVLCLELLVTAIVTVVAVVILKPAILGIQWSLDIYYWWFLAFACFLFALVLSVFAFHIYSFLMKVIYMCFLIDEELSKKSGSSVTHYASTDLVACMDDYNQMASETESEKPSYSSYGGSGSSSSSSKPSAKAGIVDV